VVDKLGTRKNKNFLFSIISFGLLIILTGCFLTEEKALEDAKKAAETAFRHEPEKINQTIDFIQLHLPDEYEIKGSSANNVFLEKDGQEILLFYNQFETENSTSLFDSIKEREDSLLLESFNYNDRLGYIAVFPNTKEEHYELQIGIGAVSKISTITTMDQLADDSGELMKLLRSVKLVEEEK
jgi:hypothetical protein